MGIGMGFNIGPLRVGRAVPPPTRWEAVTGAIGLSAAMLPMVSRKERDRTVKEISDAFRFLYRTLLAVLVAVPVMFAVIIVLLL